MVQFQADPIKLRVTISSHVCLYWHYSGHVIGLPGNSLGTEVNIIKLRSVFLIDLNNLNISVADPGFSKWGGAVLSQMGGHTSCFQVKSA